MDLMFDSLTVAQPLTEVCMSRELADATADTIREAAEYGHHIMPQTLLAELSRLGFRLYRAMRLQAGPILGALQLSREPHPLKRGQHACTP